MTARRIVYLCGLVILPLHSLLCQQPSTKPQSSAPRSSSSSELVLNFGNTASNAEGKAAANKFLHAMGGPAKVNAVTSLHQSVVALQQGRRMELEQSIVYPDKQSQKMLVQQRKVQLVVTPSDAFMVVGGQVQNLPPAQRASFDATLKHDF